MKGKNKLIALFIMLVLVVQMTGCGGVAASSSKNAISTWDGYAADAANGLRVKSVEFKAFGCEARVYYSVDGRITSASMTHHSYNPYAPFFEKALGVQAPAVEGALAKSTSGPKGTGNFLMNKSPLIFPPGLSSNSNITIIFSTTDEGYQFSEGDHTYYFLANGQFTQYHFKNTYGVGDNDQYDLDTTTKLQYDSVGRKIEMICTEIRYHKDYTSQETATYSYTYEGDTSYLKTLVYEVGGDGYYKFYKESYEYDYDENNNIVRVEQYTFTDPKDLFGTFTTLWEYEYDENGNVVCETKVEGSNQGDIVTTTRYQYDNDGNVIEECRYETFGSEEYMTSKIEYKYGNTIAQTRTTLYKYEANADYSIVNLTETVEGAWEWAYGEFYEGYDEVNDCWTVTYYTQEEIDQYMHDQEFHSVN